MGFVGAKLQKMIEINALFVKKSRNSYQFFTFFKKKRSLTTCLPC